MSNRRSTNKSKTKREVQYGLYEKKNPRHCHGIFSTKVSAERHLKETIPEYCRKGYFMDKTLKPTSFEIVRYPRHTRRK